MRHRGALLAVLVLTAGVGRADDFKPEPGYVSLFNGKDLTGWSFNKTDLTGQTETANKRFQVVDGAIVANEGKGIENLYTVKEFDKPFNLKLEFRAGPKADSGVYVRGPQLQVRDYARRGEQKQLTKFKDDDWNELDITVKDSVFVGTVNGKALTEQDQLELAFKDGKATAKLNGQPVDVKDVRVLFTNLGMSLCNGEKIVANDLNLLPAKGPIGLQAETGKFEFRRIRIKELN